MDLSFLPSLPIALSQPVLFGALLAAGLIGGEALRRYAGLPRITGYVLAGVALGPHGTGLLDAETLAKARVLIDLSLGLVVFELGFRLDLAWLRRNRWLFVTAVAESAFCFAAIFAALTRFGYSGVLAACAAAIGTATEPAVVLLVAHELRAEGQITARMLLFTAVNTVFAYLALTLLLPFLHLERSLDWAAALLQPLYLLAGSSLVGAAACALMLRLAAWLGKREDRQFVLLVALVVLTIGVARSLNLSVGVALLALGMLARNFDARHALLLPLRFGYGEQLFFVILFVLTGASLEFGALAAAALTVLAFIVVRFLGKALAILLFGYPSGIRPGGAGLLSIALLPMAGLAVVMVNDTAALYPAFGRHLAPVLLAAVALLGLLGPLATQFALRRAGEAHPEAPDV
ncbi:MAG: cation:proton antiporter [Betaproteobacteria bacterium]|nr:cation:proton antiporter [Betaproteobacteria bacterium]